MAAKAGEAGDVTLPTRERTSNPEGPLRCAEARRGEAGPGRAGGGGRGTVLSSAVLELSEEIGNHFCVDNKTGRLLSKLLHEFCIIESS